MQLIKGNLHVSSGRIKGSIILFLLVLSYVNAFSQLSADFSSSDSSGCVPLVISFKDISSGNPTSWKWDLGNGTISTQRYPGTLYLNPGVYTVKLTVTNAAGQVDSIVKTDFITVYAKPSVAFTASPTGGCVPLTVQFSDQSSAGSGTLTKWNWDFGDGTSDTTEYPVHTYSLADTFNITLVATNNFGCTQSLLKNGFIAVTDPVLANFTYTYSNICNPPAHFQFTNLSKGGANDVLNYKWSFGDGAQSSQKNPSYTYASRGNYDITLITTNKIGCSDTMVKQVAIGTELTNFISPPSACIGEPVVLQDSSSPVPLNATWDFGDGTTGSGLTVSHVYLEAGSYKVTYKANYNGCIDSLTKTITAVNKPRASFGSVSQLTACTAPLTVQFNNSSQNATAYVWDFGDGTRSTSSNPIHTYTSAGIFTVTLTASDGPGGCGDSTTQTGFIKIASPVITGFVNLPDSGCVPQTINFKAAIDTIEPVKSFLWQFGDGTTSNARSPAHTFSVAGTYSVTLIVTSSGGCTDTFTLDHAVTVSDPPVAGFKASPPNACASTAIQFTDLSSGKVTSWHWKFGDGSESFEQNPKHQYNDTGYFSVTLYVTNGGCTDSMTISKYIHINAPVAAFKTDVDCSTRMSRTFTDNSIAPLTWNWDFGDGITNTTENPQHTYVNTGIYSVTLIVTNDGCADTLTDVVYILNEDPAFTTKALHTNFCKNDSVEFTAINYNEAYINNFTWKFGDGTDLSEVTGQSLHVYGNSGVYTPSLVTTDLNGCMDTANSSVPVTISGPTAQFSNAPGTCKDSSIIFTDASYSDGSHAIIKRIWDFGDGTTDTLAATSFPHNYNNTGSYDVGLTVIDANGCSDTYFKTGAVTITSPTASFGVLDSLRCTSSSVSFINSSRGSALRYYWNFGDGQTSVLELPEHAYVSEGTYTVSLKVTDKFGCVDTMTRIDLITVGDPKAIFTATYDSTVTCPPLQVQLQNGSRNYSSVLWDFGDGNTSTEFNPTHAYTIPGDYGLVLTVHGYGNCYDDSAIQTISLKGPYGSFVFTPLSGCFPQTVNFTATTKNAVVYVWDFNDGTTQITTDNRISYQYKLPGVYTPKLILQDDAGCQVPLPLADSVKINGVFPKYVVNSQTGCDSSSVAFADSSVVTGIDKVTKRTWDFGDGTISTAPAPLHYYDIPGIYNTQLFIQTDSGCTGEYAVKVKVEVNKSPRITAALPDSQCTDVPVNFTASDTSGFNAPLHWFWKFGNGDTMQVQNGIYTFRAPGIYDVTAISTAPTGCADTALETIEVLPLPPVDAGTDSVLCRYQSVTLEATGASSYNWRTSPSLNCTDCISPVARPDSTTKYFVTGSDRFGCKATDSVLITIIQPTQLSLVSSNDTLCFGKSVQLNVTGGDLYSWQPATGLNDPSIGNPVATPPKTGLTVYTIIGTDYKKCFADTTQISILVAPLPAFNIVDTSITMNVGSTYSIKTTSSPDVVNWLWLPPAGLSCANCAEPSAQPRSNTTYTATAISNFGCTASDRIHIEVLCNDANIFIPNTFSPNGDARNDYFYPQGKGLFTIKSLRIFNRWGMLIFAKNNFPANNQTDGWNGKYNGTDQPSDVYVYVCDVICDNGTVMTYKGNITLLR